jgi:hypothetical protein
VLVVADEYDVNSAQRGGRDGRSRGLRQILVLARRVERRIHDHSAPGDVNDGGRATQHAKAQYAPSLVYRVIHVAHLSVSD